MGKLSNWHYVMRTWLQEESVQTRSGVDIISDRLMFAALAVAPLAKMRDGEFASLGNWKLCKPRPSCKAFMMYVAG